MGSCNDCALGAAKTVSEKRVPTIALASATDVANPVAERRYLFKLAPNAADSSAALAAELRRKGITKVGLIHTDDVYGRDGLAAMTGELRKAAIELVPAEEVKSTDTDLAAAVRSVTRRKPGAVVVWTSAEQATLVAREARQSAYAGQLFFDAAAAGDLFIESDAAESTDGAVMVFTQTMVIDDTIATTPAKAARKQWFRDYTARYGGYYGLSSFAADAVQLIAEAVIKAGGGSGSVNRDGIRDVIETSQLDGLSGPIRMTPDNHSGLMPQALTMLVARGGRWRLAG
jgi:branched-chain amino acid transport system substrate-binding protein